MGFSINFYLDNAISDKYRKEISISSDKEAKKELEKKISDKPLQIFIYVRYSGRTIKVYTERKCTQKQWDAEKQRVNPNYYKSGSREINKYLGKIEDAISKEYEGKNDEGININSDHVKNIIGRLNNRAEGNNKYITFEKAFEEYIEAKKQKLAANTIKKYKTTQKHLISFSNYSKTKLYFENINSQFEVKFRDYLLTKLDMSNNSIAKYCKGLKAFMNFCTFERNYNSKINLDYKRFEAKESPGEIYALTLKELMKLYNYKFNNESHSQVRDVFCFQCFTGLRFSDCENLKREDIKKDTIHLIIKKTKAQSVIALNVFAKKILGKYKNHPKPLPTISNPKTNEHLHEIGKLLKFNEQVKKVIYKGADILETYIPKYEVLTTHIGRKTFITNSLILGMKEREVKEFSGHKTDVHFNKYVKYADTYKQKVMNKAWNEESILEAEK